jgi:hypothetical protein
MPRKRVRKREGDPLPRRTTKTNRPGERRLRERPRPKDDRHRSPGRPSSRWQRLHPVGPQRAPDPRTGFTKSANGSVAVVWAFAERRNREDEGGRDVKSALDIGWPSHGRLLKNDASPLGRDRRGREKDAGSARSSATGATEDALSRRPARSGGRGFVLQQPPRVGAPPRAPDAPQGRGSEQSRPLA